MCSPFVRAPTHLPKARCRTYFAVSGGVLVRLDWLALTPALAEIRLFERLAPCVALIASSLRLALTRICGLAASWLFSSRRQAHYLLGELKAVCLMPNVRAKREPAGGRQARAVENATAPRTGPGGLPLALRLSEGLGADGQLGQAIL